MDLPTIIRPPELVIQTDMAKKPSSSPGSPASTGPPTRSREEFSRRLREARQAAGISQKALAKIMGFPNDASISHAERKGMIPSVEAVAAASAALGIDLEQYIPDRSTLRGRPAGTTLDREPPHVDSIPGRIVARRQFCGLTQLEIGERLNPPKGQPQIGRMEAGEAMFDFEGIQQIADALTVDRSLIDVRLMPESVVSVVRESPDGRWVAVTEADRSRFEKLVGVKHAAQGVTEDRIADLVAEAIDHGMAVMFRGDMGLRVKGGIWGEERKK